MGRCGRRRRYVDVGEQLARISSWVNHLVKARTRHGVHSPFIYTLATDVLRADQELALFGPVERLRDELHTSDQVIRVNDLGAGSRRLDLDVRSVSDIARTSMKPARQARLLYRLARHFAPSTILELGTSFGLSTLYMALGAPDAQVVTVEGCPQTHRIARHHFEQLGRTDIDAVLGGFRSALPELLRRMPRLDLVFIDGHHAEDPTIEYFERCLTRAHNDTVFVLDDIHWSRGMERAWERIKEHPQVRVTVDLYDMGLVFLRREQEQQHFRLRY